VTVLNNVILARNSTAPWWWSNDRNMSEHF